MKKRVTNNINDMEEEIRKKFDEVQEILDSLQDSDATCMFIGHVEPK